MSFWSERKEYYESKQNAKDKISKMRDMIDSGYLSDTGKQKALAEIDNLMTKNNIIDDDFGAFDSW
jgi:hypothetical protein